MLDVAVEQRDAFRDGRSEPDLSGKRVVIVDDGIATGATMRACGRSVTAAGGSHVTVAVPVGSPRSVTELELVADDAIGLQTPEQFRAVGQFYRSFEQVSTEDAVEYLEAAVTGE